MPLTAISRRPTVARRVTSSSPDKRVAILNAATEVFARRGFFQSQVADVARAAGVAAGTVYLYFRSKDDVLISLFERTMREAMAEGEAALAGVQDPRERLATIASLHLARLGRDRDLAIVFQVELRQSTKFMARFSSTFLREYLGLIRATIANGQRTGHFRSEINPTVAAKVFFGALDEMATNWVISNRRYSLATEADAIVDLFINGAGAAPSGVSHATPATPRPRQSVNGKRSATHGRSAATASDHD